MNPDILPAKVAIMRIALAAMTGVLSVVAFGVVVLTSSLVYAFIDWATGTKTAPLSFVVGVLLVVPPSIIVIAGAYHWAGDWWEHKLTEGGAR